MNKNNISFSKGYHLRNWILTTFNQATNVGYFLVVLFLFSCKEKLPPNTGSVQKLNLIIDVIDPSGTAIGAGWPNPTIDFYTSQITWLENNGGGILTVFNTSFEIPKEITIEVRSLESEPKAIEIGEIEFKKIQERNTRTRKFNADQKERFISQINADVINFKPEKKELDLSFLDRNIYAALKKLKEVAFASYARHIFLYTDFLNEPGGKVKQPVNADLIAELNDSQTDICACMLLDKEKENIAVKKLKASMLSSFQDFLLHLNSNTTKN